MRTTQETLASALIAAALVAAVPASGAEKQAATVVEREFTLGLVQKELRTGMSQADVASALGSPNLVTRSAQGREAWVYDRVASEARFTSTGIGAGVGGIGTPGTSLVLGLLSGQRRDERAVTTQRTLTVVVRFDAGGAVESFSFHASRF